MKTIPIGRERRAAAVKSLTPIRTVVRPPSIIEPPGWPEPEKPWAEEHAVAKNLNWALVKGESIRLGSRRTLSGKHSRPRNRRMCCRRLNRWNKYTRRDHAPAGCGVRNSPLRQRNSRLKESASQHTTNNKQKGSGHRTANGEWRHSATLLATSWVEAARIART